MDNESLGAGEQDSYRPSCGGAVFVGESGRLTFSEFASFEDNWARDGGNGGAVCNWGKLNFVRRSFFTGNDARGEVTRGYLHVYPSDRVVELGRSR